MCANRSSRCKHVSSTFRSDFHTPESSPALVARRWLARRRSAVERAVEAHLLNMHPAKSIPVTSGTRLGMLSRCSFLSHGQRLELRPNGNNSNNMTAVVPCVTEGSIWTVLVRGYKNAARTLNGKWLLIILILEYPDRYNTTPTHSK